MSLLWPQALQEELQSRRKTLEEAEVEQAELAEVERLKWHGEVGKAMIA